MKALSTTNTYSTSEGKRFTRAVIEAKTKKAKATLFYNQLVEYGYNFCGDCRRNDCKPLDASHNISVKEALETGRAELCWDLGNMKVRGRACHKKHDKL